MVIVERESNNENSCNDRESETYKIRIGSLKGALVISLCPNCLNDLYCESAKALNY